MKKARNTTGKGYFQITGSERFAKKALAVRMPESLDLQVRQLAGDNLSGWLRDAITEKIERQLRQSSQTQ